MQAVYKSTSPTLIPRKDRRQTAAIFLISLNLLLVGSLAIRNR
jgi:hypothetical protein